MLLSCDNASLYPVITRLQAVKHLITGWFFCDLKTPSCKMIAVTGVFCRISYLSKLFCCVMSFQSISFLEMSATDFICAFLIETKMYLFSTSQKSGSLILKLIIYPPERGEITEIPNVAARPRGLPLLMTSPAVTSVALFVEEDGNQHDCALAGKKISYETSRKEFLRITLSNWILISSSAVEVVSPDLICFLPLSAPKANCIKFH